LEIADFASLKRSITAFRFKRHTKTLLLTSYTSSVYKTNVAWLVYKTNVAIQPWTAGNERGDTAVIIIAKWTLNRWNSWLKQRFLHYITRRY